MFRALMHHSKPFWQISGLLSLNAPLVAMAWLYVFAKVWRVDYLPWTSYASLGLAVWMLHVSARLVEARALQSAGQAMAAHQHLILRFRRCFLVALSIAASVWVFLVVTDLPVSVFGYLLIGLILVGGFFGISLAGGRRGQEISYGRNILAGASFAYGTALFAHVFLPAHGKEHLMASREFLTFAFMCVIYFSAMDFWSLSAGEDRRQDQASGDLALLLPITLLAIASLAFAVAGHNQTVRPFYYAILTGVALIYVINRNRRRFDGEQSRALADVAMLAPALVFHAYAS